MAHPYAHPHLRNRDKHSYFSHKIGVSGAAQLDFFNESVKELSKELGREIAKHGAILMNGATTGFPYYAAMGAKEKKGICVGMSPAESEEEHLNTYRLSLDYMDFITYTGFGYAGRDLLFTRSCDAMVIGPGRVGTIHEFTIAFEDHKPIGILVGREWDTDSLLKTIIEKSHRKNEAPPIFFESDPAVLVKKLIKAIDENRAKKYVYRNGDGFGGTKGEVIL
jgi:uncharacterized protein (TIGR00725 family)